MVITEVRIKLCEENNERLLAFCSVTFDNSFVVRDLKIIEGTKGMFVAMPSRKLTAQERENISAVSVIRKKGLTVDEKIWTPAHMRLLRRAASYPEVERILVHPGIKKKLCDTVTGDR